MPSLAPASPVRGWSFWWKPALFVLVACVGLYFVKWSPYYAKAFVAADSHSIGASIINDQPSSPLSAALAYAQVYFLAIWKAAVLAVILGSLLQVLIPRDWLLRLFGRAGFGSTLRGGLFALPGMMCSCCAAPVAASMRRQNVSVGAALAFWIANPVLNPATLVFMGFVLGWGFTALRLVAGIVLVLGVSLVAQRIARPEQLPEAAVEAVVEASAANDGAFFSRWARSLWQLFWSTIPIYVLAVLVLGAARVWLFPHVEGAIGDSLLWLVPLAIVGTLFVIPTAAEIPIVQTMMALGMGTGPAVALLMTLPSISLPSLLMLRKDFDARVLVTVAGLTMLIGVVCGLIGAALL
ncbi:permease [Pseudomonas chlororaphis]|uniref:permease n=1 Tax=Pseudomonas chlororaphis TaxID=587753 RepID=UPI0007B3EF35|nr:permease [Pseudomonas chlororaphis]AZC49884.1 membrane protein YraQ [Pseudomonas chlororaphis subsp. piscium]AZC62683.1 membrane protein YraQ [Pseudomonas chlororaphis subsp. piscium]AZC68917.1 membrane protein YraQ [Pseudomonas chlororaphis subsp. piscium]AZC75101.1 membrane protein YraQ [Pseudomonas chlororaphis subsp. piscium]AZC81368.1 membrane protein YraQ [Pseudomonas chlororaphis subsp. piscium]